MVISWRGVYAERLSDDPELVSLLNDYTELLDAMLMLRRQQLRPM